MSDTERLRQRYAERKARGLCPDCGSPAGGFVRCAECRLRGNESSTRHAKSNRDKIAARQSRLYWRDPEKFRERQRQRRLEKKLRGECQDCPLPAADGSNYCDEHTEYRCARKRGHSVTPKLRARCECGERISSDVTCCARCAHLDGLDGKASIGTVVAAMRGSDGMSLRELCEAVGINSDLNNGTRQMWRWVQKLMESGRIRRYWRESSGDITKMESYRGGTSERADAVGCWAYVLNGKSEEEWQRAFVVRWMAWLLCWQPEARRHAA